MKALRKAECVCSFQRLVLYWYLSKHHLHHLQPVLTLYHSRCLPRERWLRLCYLLHLAGSLLLSARLQHSRQIREGTWLLMVVHWAGTSDCDSDLGTGIADRVQFWSCCQGLLEWWEPLKGCILRGMGSYSPRSNTAWSLRQSWNRSQRARSNSADAKGQSYGKMLWKCLQSVFKFEGRYHGGSQSQDQAVKRRWLLTNLRSSSCFHSHTCRTLQPLTKSHHLLNEWNGQWHRRDCTHDSWS